MYFCSARNCAVCFLTVGSAPCLRRQAARCLRASKTVMRRNVRETIEDLSAMLRQEANSLERMPAAPSDS
jgi:hypothetical protein